MKFFRILIFVCGFYKIFATDISSEKCIDDEEFDVLVVKYFYEKSMQISNENSEIKKMLMELNNSIKSQMKGDEQDLKFESLKLQIKELAITFQNNTISNKEQTETTEKLKKTNNELVLKLDSLKQQNEELNKKLQDVTTSNKEQSESMKKLQKTNDDQVLQLDRLKLRNEELTIKLQDVTTSYKEKTESMGKLKKEYDEQILQFDRLKLQNEDLTKEKCEDDTERLWNIECQYRSKRKHYIKQLNLDSNCSTKNCDWTVIQRREDGSVEFNRTWNDYKTGFGNPLGEFFIGLQKLYILTTLKNSQELLIIMEDFENNTRYAKYNQFEIGSESTKFVLKELGNYHGDAGDSLTNHKGMKFSTIDQKNGSGGHCAPYYRGAWWFTGCYNSHLNGQYLHGKQKDYGGINWYSFHNYDYSLKFVEMMIRPKL